MHDKESATGWRPAHVKRAIRAITRELGVKQADLARWAGISQPQISRWASGTSRPGYETLRTLQRAILERAPHISRQVEELGIAAGYPGPVHAGMPSERPADDLDGDPDAEVIRSLPGITEEQRQHLLELRRWQVRQLRDAIKITMGRGDHQE